MTPGEVIDRWCDEAHAHGKLRHKRQFWLMRDIIEGGLISEAHTRHTIEFLEDHCKPSSERKVLIDDLKRRLNDITEEATNG